MTTPTVTLRTLKNEETGIDISVPKFEEEEAPLGGVSILYEISVFTKLDLFKTSLHTSEDVVHFSIFKAYREIEELCNKLKKIDPEANFPLVPKLSLAESYSSQEKLKALNSFMEAIAKSNDVCLSVPFKQFIGITNQQLSSVKPSTVSGLPSSVSSEKEANNESEIFLKVKKKADLEGKQNSQNAYVDLFQAKLEEKTKVTVNTSSKESSSTGLFDEFDDDNLFSSSTKKVSTDATKVEKSIEKKTVVEQPKKSKVEKTIETVDDSQIIIKDRKHGDLSLFEEQDLGEYITKEEELLFLVTPNVNEGKKNSLLFPSQDTPSSETDSSLHDNLDDLLTLEPLPDSPIISKKPFEAPVVKELQQISPVDPDVIQSKNEKMLSPESEDFLPSKPDESLPTKTEVPLKQEGPLPPKSEFPLPSKPEAPLSSKPVPLPRKKSLGKIDTDTVQKPEVLPRKVFLDKPQAPSKPKPPQVAPRSSQTAPGMKPKPAPKPKPPPLKPKPSLNSREAKALDIANANDAIENGGKLSDLANDLNQLDILKYIEQEEKTLDVETNLFD